MRILLGDDLEVESNSETLGASANPTSVAESSNQIEVVPNLDSKFYADEQYDLKVIQALISNRIIYLFKETEIKYVTKKRQGKNHRTIQFEQFVFFRKGLKQEKN